MEDSVRDYVIENPYVNYKLLQQRFGTPQQIADSYIEAQDTSELINSLKIKRRVFFLIIAVATIIIITWFIIVTCAINHHLKQVDGSVETYIDIIEEN